MNELTQRRDGSVQSGSILLPSLKRASSKRVFSDRFIPHREGSRIQTEFDMRSPRAGKRKRSERLDPRTLEQESADRTFDMVLKTELCGSTVADRASLHARPHSAPPRAPLPRRSTGRDGSSKRSKSSVPTEKSTSSLNSIFSFSAPSRVHHGVATSVAATSLDDHIARHHTTTPLSYQSQEILLRPAAVRRLPLTKLPHRVLDAPQLVDDYYVNLLDWSQTTNVLAVGLWDTVWFWNGASGAVRRLCQLRNVGTTGPNTVTSIAWVPQGKQLAIGARDGLVDIWDAEKSQLIRTMQGHTARVGSLAWNGPILSTGSHDGFILHRDVRVREHSVAKIKTHRAEVCGLTWNAEGTQLASGGNDNKLYIYDRMNTRPTFRFKQHTAAVKALAWSPHQSGLLASGGGTADTTLRWWNTTSGTLLREVNTQSQICNVLWSQTSNELVSTHGYSHDWRDSNHIALWRYGPTIERVGTLHGHSYRVLYLAMSPDGETIVSGAGDETLRFWKVFPKRHPRSGSTSRLPLNVLTQIR